MPIALLEGFVGGLGRGMICLLESVIIESITAEIS